MHNPSTPNDKLLDNTMRRCMDFATDNGFGSFHVCNLFAMTSQTPKFCIGKRASPLRD